MAGPKNASSPTKKPRSCPAKAIDDEEACDPCPKSSKKATPCKSPPAKSPPKPAAKPSKKTQSSEEELEDSEEDLEEEEGESAEEEEVPKSGKKRNRQAED